MSALAKRLRALKSDPGVQSARYFYDQKRTLRTTVGLRSTPQIDQKIDDCLWLAAQRHRFVNFGGVTS